MCVVTEGGWGSWVDGSRGDPTKLKACCQQSGKQI